MTCCQMTQSTDGWFSDFLTIASINNRTYQSINTTDLTNCSLITLIVTCQIREYASCTSDNINICGCQYLHQGLQKGLHAIDFSGSVGQITQSPQTVLHQTGRWIAQVHSES